MAMLALGGAETIIPPASNPTGDNRDVAAAHIAAMENILATGRYILGNEVLGFDQITNLIKKVSPQLPVAGKVVGPARFPKLDNFRTVKELGIQFRPFEQSLTDTLNQWKDLGIIPSN